MGVKRSGSRALIRSSIERAKEGGSSFRSGHSYLAWILAGDDGAAALLLNSGK